MEDQEKKWITENLPELIRNTSCNELLLAHLQSKNIISLSEVEDIKQIARDHAKADKLYNILQKRAGSFDVLLEALEQVRQTGALAILRKLAGPKWVLDPQRMFVSAGETVLSFLENRKCSTIILSTYVTQISTDKILQNVPNSVLHTSSEILTQGFEPKPRIRVVVVPLDEKWSQTFRKLSNYKCLKIIFVASTNNKLLEIIHIRYRGTICYQQDKTCWNDLNPTLRVEITNRISKQCFGLDISNLLEQLQENMLLEVINNNEGDLFTTGIPTVASYYVDRTIFYKNAVSPSIFQTLTRDTWIFRNMNKAEVEPLANGTEVDSTSRQIRQGFVTCRFLVLDFDTDFDCICSKTKFAVHLIEKVGNNLYWKATRGSLTILLDYIEETIVSELSEAELIETLERNPSVKGNTIIISDTPGMGKSFLLESLGRRLIKHNPDGMVIYVVWSEFVDNFSVGSVIQIEDILQVVAKMVCKNELSESIFQHIVSSRHIELLLDGFDEIKLEKIQVALDILSKFNESMSNVRKWVTTRPHYKKQLEEHCCTIAYQIAPFNEQDQMRFLNSFWMYSFASYQAGRPCISGNQTQLSLNANLLSEFTKHCVCHIKNHLNQRDTDIVGIPLQCMLVADALKEDAYRCSKINNCINLSSLKFSLPINSISDLYRLFVSTKIKYYLVRTQNSKIDLQTLELVHFYYSLLLLFPKQATKFNLQDNVASVNAADYLAVGILQAGCLHDSPRFIHRTFAEHFIAEFCIQQMQQPVISDYFLDFFFKNVLSTELTSIYVPRITTFDTFCFQEKTLCHFLNSSIEVLTKSNDLCILAGNLDKFYKYPYMVREVSHASAVDNFANLFNFLAVTNAFHCHQNHLVFDKHFFHIIVFKFELGCIKASFELYDSIQQKTSYKLEDSNSNDTSYSLSDNLKQTVINSWIIYETIGKEQRSLLHTAMKRGDSSIVSFIVQHIGFKNVLEDCPLEFQNLVHSLVENSMYDSCDKIESRRVIIKKLVELNQGFTRFEFEGRQAILCNNVHVRLIEELLAVGVDPFCEDTNKNTLWHLVAARSSCSDFYRLLTGITCWNMRSKIVNVEDQNGNTVLQVLVKSSNPEKHTLKLLKKCGADFNTRNSAGFTPIFTVVSSDQDPNIIKLLLQYGADITCTSRDGLQIFHYAALLGDSRALVFLSNLQWKKYGIGNVFSWKDRNGQTPLNYAQSPSNSGFDKQFCVDIIHANPTHHNKSIRDNFIHILEHLLHIIDDETLCTTFSAAPEIVLNQNWKFFRVYNVLEDKLKDAFRLIVFHSSEQKSRSIDFMCRYNHLILTTKDDKTINIERKCNIDGLTPLLESIVALSSFLKFSLGVLDTLSPAARSVAIGDFMVSWVLDQQLSDDLIVAHLEWCILNGTNINSWSKNGSPLLNELIKISLTTKPLRFLLDQGANIDKYDCKGNGPLHVLFDSNRCATIYETTSLLIEAGANIHKHNADGDSPLILLQKSQRVIDIRTYILLQSVGAIFDSKIASLTIRWLASSNEFSKNETLIGAFKYLINKGANLFQRGQKDDLSTIDMILSKFGQDLAELLLQLQRDYENKQFIMQIDNHETFLEFKLAFLKFSSDFEITNPNLMGTDTYEDNEYSPSRFDLIHLKNVLNEVYSDNMSDIAIIFAYVISFNFLDGLILVCDWCKKRDASLNLRNLQFKYIKEKDHWAIFYYSVYMCSFECLQHLVENEGFRQHLFENSYQDILHACLGQANCDKIIKYLSNINPNLLRGKSKGKTLFESKCLYPNAFLALMEAGASIDDFVISESNICNTHNNGPSIMHFLPRFVDSNTYHKFILEIHSKNLLQTLFLKGETGYGQTPLQEAISCFELEHETLKLLIHCGVKINLKENTGYKPLMIAIRKKHSLSFLQTLIKMGAEFSKEVWKDNDSFERTILHYMIQFYFQDSATLNLFLKFCLEENLMHHFKAFDKDGNTALHYVFQYQHQHITADMLPILFSDSGFIGLTNKNNQTVLHYATEFLCLTAYETLIPLLKSNNKLFLFNHSDFQGNTPLYCLAKDREKSECISKHLIGEQEINFNITNALDETFLHCLATQNLNQATLESLLASGVDLCMQNKDGKTFVHCFIDNNASEDIHTLFAYLVKNKLTEILLRETADEELLTSVEYGILRKKIFCDTLEFLKRSGLNLNQVNPKSKKTLIHLAAEINDFHMILCLLNLDIDATQQDEHGNTFIHALAYNENAICFQGLTKFLVEKKINNIFTITNKLDQTPLHIAAEANKLTPVILNLIKSYFADINMQDNNGRSLLHCSFLEGCQFDILLLQTLLEVGVDPALVDKSGDTFLHYAAVAITNTDFYSLIKYLSSRCDAAALFGMKNCNDGDTPLHSAVQNMGISLETFDLLKLIPVNFDIINNNGESILMLAPKVKYSVATLKFLIENKYCNVYIKDNEGSTFAHIMSAHSSASEFHDIATCLVCCGHGDLFGTLDNFNSTPLHDAVTLLEILPSTLDLLCGRTQASTASNADINANKFPRKSFVDLNAVDIDGFSILDYAVCGGRSLKFVKYLVELGAKLETKNYHNSNLALEAAVFGDLELLEYFVGLGCDINELDNDGDNALQCVVLDSSKNVYEKVEYLLRQGVDKTNVNKKGKMAYDYAVEKGITDRRILNLLS